MYLMIMMRMMKMMEVIKSDLIIFDDAEAVSNGKGCNILKPLWK